MYDVVFIDPQGTETPIALHVVDKHDAARIACRYAAERKAGRMMLPGSAKTPNTVCVVPVPGKPPAAAA